MVGPARATAPYAGDACSRATALARVAKDRRPDRRQAAASDLFDYIPDNERDFENVEYSEKSIEISLGEGVSVVGRIDLVRRLDTNETYVVDYRTRDRVQPEDVTED